MPSKPSYRARWVSYLLPITLFFGIAAVALLLVRGYSFDWSDGLRKTGLIVLDSTPKNAYITVNDHVESKRTRATLKLAPGDYTVKVDMPDVHPWEKQIRLEPGEAELEEHILLFRTEPRSDALTPGRPPAEALSSSGNDLAFLTAGADSVTLSTTRIRQDGPESATSLGTLPTEYTSPRSLSWSADGSRIVVSAGNETRIVTTDGRQTTLPAGGRAISAPGQPDAAIVESEPGRLVKATGGDPAGTVEPYENNVTAWTAAGRTVYVAHTDGSLVRRSNATDRRVISQQPVLTDLSAAAEDTEAVFGRDASKTLFRITDKGPEQLATDVERYAISRDGDQVAYLKQRELRLWDRLKQTDRLLTRFTDPPEQLAVIPGGYYVLYGRPGTVHAIAADGTNDTTLANGVDLTGVINREQVLVRDRTSGRTLSLTILER